MICLGPQREHWQPEKPCDCKYTIHKKCWEQWEKQSHGDCLICRDEKQQIIRDLHYQLIFVEPNRLPCIVATSLFIIFIGLFTIFIVIVGLSLRASQLSIKDEL
jgi:hypothetical protein